MTFIQTWHNKILGNPECIHNTINLPECDPASELSNREFWLAPSNSSTESFIAVWKTANWPNTTEGDKMKTSVSQLSTFHVSLHYYWSTHQTEETRWCNRSRSVWWCSSVGSLVTERLPLSLRTVPRKELQRRKQRKFTFTDGETQQQWFNDIDIYIYTEVKKTIVMYIILRKILNLKSSRYLDTKWRL